MRATLVPSRHQQRQITSLNFAPSTHFLVYHLTMHSGYAFGPINESKFLRRVIFLETVAGIPGMVAGSLRHLMSLRTMKRDHG